MATLEKTDPAHYSEEYYLKDCDGWREYLSDLDKNVHPKFKRALLLGDIKTGQRVLDIGCGRGEMAYYCAKRGAKVVSVDYSDAAVSIAKQTISRLPKNEQGLVTIMKADVSDFKPEEIFDTTFMIDMVEHIYDWQLQNILSSLRNHLSDNGRIIISTPNRNYEKFLYPLKRLINYPYKPVKWVIRVLRGKYKPKSFGELLKNMFKVFPEKRDKIDIMHVNIMTPNKLKRILEDQGYIVDLKCEDYSYNILSILLKRWFGRELIAIARKK